MNSATYIPQDRYFRIGKPPAVTVVMSTDFGTGEPVVTLHRCPLDANNSMDGYSCQICFKAGYCRALVFFKPIAETAEKDIKAGLFRNLQEAVQECLDHPAPFPPPSLDELFPDQVEREHVKTNLENHRAVTETIPRLSDRNKAKPYTLQRGPAKPQMRRGRKPLAQKVLGDLY